MRLALTGASGFIGRHVIRAAVQRGFEVIAFTRNPAHHVHNCVETRRFNLKEVPDFTDCEGIVHLAGESVVGFWTAAKKRRIMESRVRGTQRVVEGIRALKKPPEVLVSASAVGFYGDAGDAEITEQTPPGAGYLAEVCARWEAEAETASSCGRVARVRISNVLGKEGGMLKSLRPFFRWGLGGRLGHGRQWMPWIHVEDLAALLLFAVENMEVRGPVNGSAPWPVTNAEFTRTLARVLHRPALFPVPAWALRTVFREFGRSLLASVRAVPAAALEAGFRFRYSELEPALRAALA